jgi:hypothetical protein
MSGSLMRRVRRNVLETGGNQSIRSIRRREILSWTPPPTPPPQAFLLRTGTGDRALWRRTGLHPGDYRTRLGTALLLRVAMGELAWLTGLSEREGVVADWKG